MKIFNYTLLTVLIFLVACTKSETDVVGDITLLGSTNVRGQLDPCGWKKNPLGGLSRKSTYVKQLNNEGYGIKINRKQYLKTRITMKNFISEIIQQH